MPRFALDSADDAFFGSAPHVFTYRKRFAAPPEQVWASLTSDESLATWGASVKSVDWLSPRPFGVGTTREVALAPGLVRVHETFLRWEERVRHSFYVVAIEAKPALAVPFKALAPVLKVAFGRLADDGERFFEQRA